MLLIRGLLSPAAHLAWTGLSAAALFAAGAAGARRGRRTFEFTVTFVVAVLLHTAWDSVDTTPATALVAIVSLTLLAVTMRKLWIATESENQRIEHSP